MKTEEDRGGELEWKVREALREVVDPELGYNVVDLGLIYGVTAQGDQIEIVMTATTPGCPAVYYMTAGVRAKALAVPGVRDAHVRLVWSPPWSPELMSEEAKRHLGFAS